MDKVLALEKLKQEIIKDKSLPLKSNLVFGEGNPNCDVLFIGEAPGALEDELVRPFVGRSGQLLRKNIRALGWKEEDVYVTNIVKRRPPENRDPLPQEIEKYRPYLARQIEIIKPKIIVPLGRFSMDYFLASEGNKKLPVRQIIITERATKICSAYFLPDAKITRDQGKLLKVEDLFIIPMFHPAAALRATSTMKEFEGGFKKLPAAIKKVMQLKQLSTD